MGDLWKGEYLNIGVFAYDADPLSNRVCSKFVDNLDRIEKAFGWKDQILREIFEHLRTEIKTKLQLEDLIKSSNSPYSSMQFTEPRASIIEDPQQLVDDVSKHFLTG